MFSIERTGLGPVEFEGVQLATSTTRTDSRPRWSEFELYRTTAGKYVVVILGCSSLAGEDTIRTVKVARNAAQAVRALVSKSGRLSYPAETLLETAAEEDDDIDAALDALNDAVHID